MKHKKASHLFANKKEFTFNIGKFKLASTTVTVFELKSMLKATVC